MPDETHFPTRRELRAAERAQAAENGIDEFAQEARLNIQEFAQEAKLGLEAPGDEDGEPFTPADDDASADLHPYAGQLGAAEGTNDGQDPLITTSAAEPTASEGPMEQYQLLVRQDETDGELPRVELGPALAALVASTEDDQPAAPELVTEPETDEIVTDSAPAPLAATEDDWVSPFGDARPQPVAASRPIPARPTEVEPAPDDLFQYPQPAPAAAALPAPILPPGTPTLEEEKEAERNEGKPKNKGVNMFSMIGGTAALVAAAFMFVPSLTMMALPAAGAGLLACLIGTCMPHYRRIPSTVALVIALGAAGYIGYMSFFA